MDSVHSATLGWFLNMERLVCIDPLMGCNLAAQVSKKLHRIHKSKETTKNAEVELPEEAFLVP